ncbi:MAG: hypothetical protein H6Q38_581 [Chloroflexi bacterium]|nr:hypothetical protein [Chloroflexota bacterium]
MINVILMGKHLRIVFLLVGIVILLNGLAWGGEFASAQAPETPKRTTTLIVPYTEYTWWLISWEDNNILCSLAVDHEGVPTAEEVQKQCGLALYEVWKNTPPCEIKTEDTTECPGLYLHLVATQSKKREVVIELPQPVVWVNLEGCTPTPPDNLCPIIPTLVLSGEEPLPDEQIIAIRGNYDGVPFSCQGDICKVPLHPSPLQGSVVEFWADSSYGDSSEHYFAKVRVIDTGVSNTPGGGGWYIDVISDQWQGAPLETCARIWESFPPFGGTPTWLTTPEHSQIMASGDPLFYLAGRLISQNLVNITGCPSGGLQPNGYANTCGLERARPVVEGWQNQFDQRMIEVSRETGVPAQLMKNLFAQESQFWPGMFRVPYEFGLGQITAKGADSIFLWNPTFYSKYCPMVLGEDTCSKSYLRLNENERALLRGSLAIQANADCVGCPSGVNLNEANFSISLFANTLKANCAQVNQMVLDATGKPAGVVSNYEDLWRFTIASYHAGPGCVAFAMHMAWQNTSLLNWDTVSVHFTEPCKGVVPYVNTISELDPQE